MDGTALQGLLARPTGRFSASAIAGAVVTLALYWVMQSLIATTRGSVEEGIRGQVIDFVRLRRDETLETKDRKPEKPPEAEKPPEVPPLQSDSLNPNQSSIEIGQIAPDVRLGGLGISAAEGDYMPIVKVAPMYPLRAQQRGIEGWVLLEFTVTKTGAVRDPFVVEAKPSGIFDRSAIQAALKFKYKPMVVDGQPIEVPGVRNRIVFQLEK